MRSSGLSSTRRERSLSTGSVARAPRIRSTRAGPQPVSAAPAAISPHPKPQPTHLVVAGMHRSGTSLIASYLAALGVDMGESIPADKNNPQGYFEDRQFLELNRRILRQLTAEQKVGHRDWGWTESERLDASRIGDFGAEAAALLERRGDSGPWGFKDPRASLLLDFWDSIATTPAAHGRYLLLYRYPWDVADSMQRLGVDIFLDHPEHAYRIWAFYNRYLLRFYRENRDRILI